MTVKREIQKVDREIRAMNFPRLVVFADVVNRYTNKVFRSKTSWLRTSALFFMITRGGSLTPSQLARIMLRSNYSVTKIIDGLEKDGLVRRRRNRRDRRTVNVQVTPAGLEFVMASLNNATVAEDEVKSCLSNNELKVLADLTRKLRLRLIDRVSERYSLSVDDRRAIFEKPLTWISEMSKK